ncbi:helix-turn-helix transcriptional regulator [Clostridium amazonitimonense]|uniref:helix-turn-helix transcriptional regulator n=1 Tax=Clostridium amazonitimonense TaxID=1499689 RepID=UPI000509C517|nr:AraC family transcriptional regulator [Clostridium amazonitimonense]
MANDYIKKYETNNLHDKNCIICEEFGKIYNLEGNMYRFEIPKEIGCGYIRQISSYEGLQIIDFDMTLDRTIEFQGVSQMPHVDMLFCLGDKLEWDFSQNKNNFQISSGESFLSNSKKIEKIKKCTYLSKHRFHFIEIKIHPSKFNQITKDVKDQWGIFCSDKSNDILYKSQITPAINVILQQILSCPYEKGLKDIYIKGKVLELLAIYLNETVFQKERYDFVKLSKEDIMSLYKAKEILDKDIINPPSLQLLSKMIYINEFKLKNGFKELFGQTVYSYIIDRRLEMARLLFETNKINVSSVANYVGYANKSHFALAFRKKFGVNPGEYLKNVANNKN